nr:ribonuclease H-like domain-containing protein [Tanacetum cinerariifolium]
MDQQYPTVAKIPILDTGKFKQCKYKIARELWAAILKTFGGNEATKKTKKNLLKQQYGNFRAEGSETLEQTFSRLQVNDLDTMSIYDLYNHLKVYESEVQKKTEPNSQNMAFISSAKHNSGKEDGNTTCVPTASTNVPTASASIATDINQIDEDDMDEMDIKWNMALLSMRADKLWKRTGKKISIQGSDVVGFDKSKVKCFNCHKMGHFARECRAPRSQDRGRRDNFRQGSKAEEQALKALMAIDGVGWDWSYMANNGEDHALVADEEAPTEFVLMANTSTESKVFDNSLCSKDYKKNNDSLNNTTDTTTTTTISGETGTKSGRTVTLTAEDMQKKKNDATKKTKKNLLKQQYGNFRGEGSETLEQTFSRLQVIVGQLQFMDVEVEKDDLNQKFLTSLAPEWLMHTIVWRNRSDLDTMSLDDLYNHLKVYESEVQKKTDPNSQNMAFISSAKHSSRNEDGNTACVPTASTNVPTASASVATISQDTAFAYIASQSSGSQIKFEDINQIDEDDMEEMNIKWNMALLSMRADKFWKRTWKKISIQGSDVAGFDKSKVKCFNCHKMGHFARECRAPRSQDRGRRDNYRQGSKAEEQVLKALMAIDGVGWDWSYMANDGEDHALVADDEAPTEFALMANTNTKSKVFDNSLCSKDCKKNNDSLNKCIETLKKKLETLKQEKEGVDGKLAGLLTASKDLDNLIESQRSDKNKEGLGYTAVPPPPVQLYLSPKKDLSWTGLPECADDTVTDYSRSSPTVESTSEEDQNRNPSVYENVASPITPKPFIKFVKPKDSQSESKTDKKETPKKPPVKYVEQYRKPNKVRGNQRNWNNLKSHQLGPEFVMKKKSCFNCGDFNHLAYECRKRVRKSFTPKPVPHRLYKPSQRPVRTNMNGASLNRTSFNKQAHSYGNKSFHRTSAVRSPYRPPCVPTVNRYFSPANRKFSTGSRNFPTANRKFSTASRKFPTGSTKSPTADMGIKGKAVKPSACWSWKPSQHLSNKGPKNNSGSSQNKIDDKGYWDSGCSTHMTGNISYLSDYEPFDRGYVSFSQGGCKITGKGTIKTGKLEFKNVYFIKDLKYNLFSVSQICDNKNNVLFTDSECIVLGRDFKLLDDANILLRTPRQHNMYSIDLNNIAPYRDLTCLVAKASADE